MPTPPEDKTKLPSDLRESLSQTEANDDDKIVDLLGQLQIAKDALEESHEKIIDLEKQNAKLESHNELLRDNYKIKRFAVRFSFWFIWLVPIFSILLLILSINDGISFGNGVDDTGFYLSWSVTLNSYAQAALIIAPIAFIATVLGFLLKGVFGRPGDNNANTNTLSEINSIVVIPT